MADTSRRLGNTPVELQVPPMYGGVNCLVRCLISGPGGADFTAADDWIGRVEYRGQVRTQGPAKWILKSS